MSESNSAVTQYVEAIPTPEEIRKKLAANVREAKLLRQILRLAEQREKVREVSS